MASDAQKQANFRNSQRSTGPRTEAGRAASSKNHLIHGLYTQTDFVLPDEIHVYALFCERFEESCDAGDAIEECLTHEITSAAWRLRRCNLADGDVAQHSVIDPLLDETLAKQIRSIERARSHSTSVFHRGLNQLKKLQKERFKNERFKLEPNEEVTAATPEPEPEQKTDPCAGLRPEFLQRVQQKLDAIMNEPAPDWDEIDRQIAENKEKQAELASNCNVRDLAAGQLASNCKPAPTPARGRPCPCKSGKKYKHCCGKNTPWQSGGVL